MKRVSAHSVEDRLYVTCWCERMFGWVSSEQIGRSTFSCSKRCQPGCSPFVAVTLDK